MRWSRRLRRSAGVTLAGRAPRHASGTPSTGRPTRRRQRQGRDRRSGVSHRRKRSRSATAGSSPSGSSRRHPRAWSGAATRVVEAPRPHGHSGPHRQPRPRARRRGHVEAVSRSGTLGSVAEMQDWIRARRRRGRRATPGSGRRVCSRRACASAASRRAQELDAAAPDHPVVVDGAYAFVLNTAALARRRHHRRDTPDPPGGAIVQAAVTDSRPAFCATSGGLLARFRPPPTGTRAARRARRRCTARTSRIGITSIVERGASWTATATYEALHQAGRLRVRATVTIRLPPDRQAGRTSNAFIDALPVKPRRGRRRGSGSGPLKIVADGGILAGTSFMREPYGARVARAVRRGRPRVPRVPDAHAGRRFARRWPAGHRARLADGRRTSPAMPASTPCSTPSRRRNATPRPTPGTRSSTRTSRPRDGARARRGSACSSTRSPRGTTRTPTRCRAALGR